MTNHRKPQRYIPAHGLRFVLQRKRDDHFLASVQIPYAWTESEFEAHAFEHMRHAQAFVQKHLSVPSHAYRAVPIRRSQL